jgi:hypothetical protein
VLSGAQSLLRHTLRPLWLVEITTRENQPADCPLNPHFESTFRHFFELGYRAYVIVQGNGDLLEINLADVRAFAGGAKQSPGHNYLMR